MRSLRHTTKWSSPAQGAFEGHLDCVSCCNSCLFDLPDGAWAGDQSAGEEFFRFPGGGEKPGTWAVVRYVSCGEHWCGIYGWGDGAGVSLWDVGLVVGWIGEFRIAAAFAVSRATALECGQETWARNAARLS